MEEAGSQRTIWGRTFELVTCNDCGQAFLTREQVDHLVKTRGFTAEHFERCDTCRRNELSGTLAGILNW
jgi:hypothetical protein